METKQVEEKSDHAQKIEQYERYLCAFCKQSAHMENLKIRIESGEVVSEKEMTSHFISLRDCKDALLETKKELGFAGGLDFTDDCNYQGFQYVNGQLRGDVSNLPMIIMPWLKKLDEEKPFKYEVGMLMLFHYMMQEERRKELVAKQRKQAFFPRIKKGMGRIFRLFKSQKRRYKTYD